MINEEQESFMAARAGGLGGCTIPLTRGYVAIVDVADFDRVAQFKWTTLVSRRKDGTIQSVYAHRRVRVGDKRASQKLHRFILGIDDPKIQVDHRDHDGLNCRRYNLRTATHKQNCYNKGRNSNNSSGYKGVSFHPVSRKWRAQIRIDDVRHSLGLFSDPVDAARAYDAAALSAWGEFACVNFPTHKETT